MSHIIRRPDSRSKLLPPYSQRNRRGKGRLASLFTAASFPPFRFPVGTQKAINKREKEESFPPRYYGSAVKTGINHQ